MTRETGFATALGTLFALLRGCSPAPRSRRKACAVG